MADTLTVKIKSDLWESGFVIICASDYDPAVDELFVDEDPATEAENLANAALALSRRNVE
jgi:hypothetical protein